ncbi:MAG: RHS repeat-associated core domain-containing protein [Bryobacteraceae bacterium]
MACAHHFDDAYTLVGDPVNAVTGASLDTRLEFQMPGPIPFQWVRHYDSSKCRQYYALGWGRTHGYDHRLQFDVDGIRYTAPVGRVVGFPPLTQDGEKFAYGGYVLHRVTWRLYRLHHSGEPSMEFDFSDMAVASLARVFRGKDAIQFYYGNGRLQGIVDSRGRHIAATVDDAGRMIALVLEGPNRGRPLIDYYYDLAGNVIESVDPYRNSFKMRYDEHNREVVRTDRRGYSFYFEYDQQGRCVRTTGEDGLHETHLEYHPPEGFTLVTRADGGRWTYLCPDGQLERIIDPYGGSLNFKRDESGRIIEEIDSNGNVTKVRYDANGALAGKVTPLGRYLPEGEDATGPSKDPFAILRFMPANEDTERARRDPSLPRSPLEWEFGSLYRRLMSTTDVPSAIPTGTGAQLPTWSLKYLRSLQPQPDGRVYDDFGKLVREDGPNGSSLRRLYDANGSLHRLTDRDGSVHTYQNASWNLRVGNVNPLGQAERFTYTKTEKLASFTDRGGTVSEYEYDLKDQLIRVRRHGPVRDEYRRDNSGNLIEKLDGNGKRLYSFEIGPGGLRTARHLDGGEKHGFGYDKQGRIVSAVTAAAEVQLEYDRVGNRVTDQRNGAGVTHVFNGLGRLVKTTYFGRFQVQYLADNSGTVTILDPRGCGLKIQSLGDGTLLRTMVNGSSEIAQFDEKGRCLLKATRRRGDGTVWARQYSYSGEGNLLKVEDSARGITRYSYDADHRLSSIEQSGQVQRLAYDAADNLLLKSGLVAAMGDGNRLQAANGDQFEYNPRNHIASRKGAGETRYYYDALDMLTACEVPGGRWEAEYDALSRRIAKVWKGRTEYYWDGDRLAAEVCEGGAVRLYLYADEFAITPLLFLDYESIDADPVLGTVYYIYGNHQGTPVLVEDEACRTVWEARLDPYGSAQIDPRSTIQLALRFPGHYHDPEIGLHYNRYRYYSPELGRYLQSDPLGIRGGSNLYAYAKNPLKSVDVLGLNDCGPDDEEDHYPPPDPETVARTGNPSAAKTRWEGEPPYHNPDEMYLIAPGLPLDVNGLNPKKTYLWVVDPNGNVLIAPERQPGFGANRKFPDGRPVKHGDLTPSDDGQSRGPARAGGELRSINDSDGNPTGMWEMNNDSSYTFNRTDEQTGTQDNLDASHDLLTQSGTDTSKIMTNNTSGVR